MLCWYHCIWSLWCHHLLISCWSNQHCEQMQHSKSLYQHDDLKMTQAQSYYVSFLKVSGELLLTSKDTNGLLLTYSYVWLLVLSWFPCFLSCGFYDFLTELITVWLFWMSLSTWSKGIGKHITFVMYIELMFLLYSIHHRPLLLIFSAECDWCFGWTRTYWEFTASRPHHVHSGPFARQYPSRAPPRWAAEGLSSASSLSLQDLSL